MGGEADGVRAQGGLPDALLVAAVAGGTIVAAWRIDAPPSPEPGA